MLDISNVTTLRSGSLVDQLTEQITNAIINHELEPGDRLPSESELSEMFQVGKSSVRESIKILQAFGIVEVRRGEGTFITKETPEEVFNPVLYRLMLESSDLSKLVELRRIFEPACTLLAMEKATDEDLQAMSAELERFSGLIEKGIQTGNDDIAFHKLVLNATKNPYIIRIGEMIYKLLEKSINKGCRSTPELSLGDHYAIYDALAAKDARKLEEAELTSFRGWIQADN